MRKHHVDRIYIPISYHQRNKQKFNPKITAVRDKIKNVLFGAYFTRLEMNN